MIIPTPEFDPFFAHDEIPFQEKMRGYIEREFSELIDPRQLQQQIDSTPEDALADSNDSSSAENRRVA